MKEKQKATLFTELAQNIILESEMSANLGGHIITITEDKVRLACISHLARIAERKAWVTPASLFLAIVIVFVTADFKRALGFSADTWRALFLFAGAWTFMWTTEAVLTVVRGSTPSIDDFVSVLKAAKKT